MWGAVTEGFPGFPHCFHIAIELLEELLVSVVERLAFGLESAKLVGLTL